MRRRKRAPTGNGEKQDRSNAVTNNGPKNELKEVIEKNIQAFGCEFSKARMSTSSPIKVELKENHSQILARGRPLGQ